MDSDVLHGSTRNIAQPLRNNASGKYFMDFIKLQKPPDVSLSM